MAPTLYQELGAKPGLTKLVAELIKHYRADPRINALFQDANLEYFGDRLFENLCVRSGGDCVYQGLSMAEAHSGMNISEAEFNWFVEDTQDAMNALGLPVSTQNRLLQLLARDRPEVIRQ